MTKDPIQQDVTAALVRVSGPQEDVGAGWKTIPMEINARTLRPRVNLVLRLDYFAEPQGKESSRRFPKCVKPFEPHMEIGGIYCDGQDGSLRPLYAGMVEQDCYTRTNDVSILPKEAIVFERCGRILGQLHLFDPPLRLDTQNKD